MRKITISTLLLFSFLLTGILSAQVATNYTFGQATGTFTAIATGPILVNASGDMDEQIFGPIAMPAFAFDGTTYTSCYVSTNGFLTFGAVAPQTFYYEAISGTDAYSGAIAAFCEDLDQTTAGGTKNIRYTTVGTEFIVQWQNVSRYGLTGERISFQIRLNNANNQIKIVYGGTITPRASVDYPEVGLRGADNTFATNVNNRRAIASTGSWINSVPGTSNTSDMYFNNATATTVPAVGLTYTWTPPAVDIQAASVLSPSMSTGGCFGNSNAVTVSVNNTGGSTLNFATTPLTVNVSTTGPNPMSFPAAVINTGTLAPNTSLSIPVATGYDMSANGNYVFTLSTAITGDAVASNNASSVTINSHTPSVTASSDVTICEGQSVALSSTGTSYLYTANFLNTTPLPIPDADPLGVSSTIVVTGLAAMPASNVMVRIDNLSHTYDADLIISLVAPDGSTMLLSDQNGIGEMNFIQTLFTPTAVNPISTGVGPYTGSFLPDQAFTLLTGFADGNWMLHISDEAGGDVGTLTSWTLLFDVPNSIVSYSWSPSSFLDQSNVSNPVATPPVTSTYVVTATDESGCTKTEDVVITVNPAPVVAVTGNTTICDGSTTTLTASGAVSYAWSSGGTTAMETVAPSASTAYSVVGTDVNGCTDTTAITVNVNSLPVIAVAGTTSVCDGNSTTLTASGASTYSWSSGGTTDTEILSPISTGSYTVTGTDINGCVNTNSVTVTVNPLPTVTITGNTSVCDGSSTTLTASGASTYSWSSGGTTDTETLSPAVTDAYTVTGTDANGCVNTNSVTVTVNPLPTVSISGNTTICNGSSTTLTAGGASAYAWSSGGTTAAETVSPSATSSYTATGTDANGCTNTSSVTVTVNPVPVVTVSFPVDTICANGGLFTLTGESPAGGIWSGNGVSGNALDPLAAGLGIVQISYTYTDANTCSATATQPIYIDNCTGIENVSEAAIVSVWPNPTSGVFTISFANTTGMVAFDVMDLQGKIVYSENGLVNNVNTIDISHLANGTYFLRVTTETQQTQTLKMVKSN
ncbi:MAG: T9SS type A sorting domain-containing protein [Bacteroidia bacterium]